MAKSADVLHGITSRSADLLHVITSRSADVLDVITSRSWASDCPITNLPTYDFITNGDLATLEKDFASANYDKALRTCQIVIDYVWEKLNTGHWKDVEDSWRHLYYTASCYKCLCELTLGIDVSVCLKTCDMGILMGVKPPAWSKSLTDIAAGLSQTAGSNKRMRVDGTGKGQ